MSFHQLSLIADGPTPGRTRRGGVQRTSVLAYLDSTFDKDSRVSASVRTLNAYVLTMRKEPTSRELAAWIRDDVVWTRCGLSDAKSRGLVENAGKRHCSVSGKLALTWKVVAR